MQDIRHTRGQRHEELTAQSEGNRDDLKEAAAGQVDDLDG